MQKYLIWDFHRQSSLIIKHLIDRNYITDYCWFCNDPIVNKEKYKIKNVFDIYDVDRLLESYAHETYLGKGKVIYETIYNRCFGQYHDMLLRYFERHGNSEKRIKQGKDIRPDFHEALNWFNIHFDYLHMLLLESKITCVLFNVIPHGAPQFLLYHLAKELNIVTIIFHQSIFKNMFFVLENIDGNGLFTHSIPLQNYKYEKIENIYNKKIWYMDSKYIQKSNLQKKINKLVNNPGKYFIKFIKIFNYKNWRLIKQVNKNRNYISHWNTKSIENPNLESKYVYFPLQLQPEMTTSSIGGIYVDQIRAIEDLSTLIPNDWFIYVKENPKQSSYMRDEYFFKRLARVKNVVLVSTNKNTYELIEMAQFVASITGTVGWEAITGGKNAICFGKPWYRNLPGIFEYKHSLSSNEIMNYKINHKELEEKISLMKTKMGLGVVDPGYYMMFDEFNLDEKSRSTAIEIEKILDLYLESDN